MEARIIRQRFLDFFAGRGHAVVPSASLVPLNDPSVLFTTAGMQPLVPYLMGESHPSGSRRIVDSQKCVRTNDIEEVGDNTHLTFFEMLGNWSLGDYFKKEAINWSFEFLTSKEEGLGLDPKRLYVTVFEGDENAPRDTEAYEIWKEIFEREGLDPDRRIFFMDADSNWWSPGDNGPCGPDSEMFYDVSGTLTEGLTKEEFIAADDRQDVVEIWNDVFMEYEKKDGKVIGKLASQNVDTGSGLERVTGILQGVDNVFETDLFAPILAHIRRNAKKHNTASERIIADHMRAAVFLIGDGVTPGNTDQGYVLRRLLRRAIRHANTLGLPAGTLAELAPIVAEKYGDVYPEVRDAAIAEVIADEESRFRKTLERGLRKLQKMLATNPGTITAEHAFDLYQTDGFPIEMIAEELPEGVTLDTDGFNTLLQKHQETSRAGAEQKFKGGLADASEKTTQLHTTHHILLRALQMVLGEHVKQRGSNITGERLRIDFSHGEKMTEEQKREVERIVNETIQAKLPMLKTVMPREEAETLGAEQEFGQKYPDEVSVYSIGPADATPENPKIEEAFSKEFCGGPHVANTGDILGSFHIAKEQASAAGIRRIRGVLE